MSDNEIDQMAEIEAMKGVAEALKGLPQESRGRVLRWAADSYGITGLAGSDKVGRAVPDDQINGVGTDAPRSFENVADLFSAADPATEPDKALVVGYWLQYMAGEAEFDSQRVNKILKDLGHSVSNITRAFSSLNSRRPQLAMQTRKSGSSQQARKLYKLTQAGKSAVENMMSATSA